MRTLYKKALRDVRGRFGSYLACAMVMAIGLMMYAAMTSVVESIPIALHAFYEDYRFADAFATIHSIPESRISRIGAIDGIKKVSGRLTATVRMVGEDNVELKLISYDPLELNRLNDIGVLEGAAPRAGHNELCLNTAFFSARGISAGDNLQLSMNGKRYDFAVSGSVWMPEYIYVVPEGSLFADDTKYGIAYAPIDVIEGILNMRGERNDVAVLLDEGAEFDDLKRTLEDELSPYGLYRLTERKDQTSHFMLEQEITSMKAMVGVVPIVFLFMGALIMSVIVKRTIEQQRVQIGLMKAFGYSSSQILSHYSIYGIVIGLMASISGSALGRVLSSYMADMYQEYFHMPGISGEFTFSSVIGLSVLALIFAVGASLYGARGVLKLSAAEAMSAPAPKRGKPILLERVSILWGNLGSCTRMALRNLFRSKSRSISTLTGLIICFALTTAVFAMGPIADYMINENFFDVQRYDIRLSLRSMSDGNGLIKTLSSEKDVELVEAVLELPATVRKGVRSKDTSIMAIESDSTLYRLFDDKRKPIRMPQKGAVITYRLADALNIEVGDTMLIDIPYPDMEISVRVAALCEQYSSNYVLIDRTYLCELMRMRSVANGAMLKLGTDNSAELIDRLSEGENVTMIYDILDMQHLIEEMMETSMQMLYTLAAMAVFAGFAIVYNSSVVSLSERTRELASMRVLGFTLFETVRVVSTEQLILLCAGMAVGAPLAGYLTYLLAMSMSTDAYSMPYGVAASTYIQVVVCFLCAWFIALLIVARKVSRTPMADVLKTRE